MARGSDIGNFVLLLVGAGAAGVFLGDWAGRTVLWIGIVAMGVGAVVYILQSWGINLDASSSVTPNTASATSEKVRSSKPDELPKLAAAVATRDHRKIEELVLSRNLSPFQNTSWKGETLSAHQLATRIGYDDAVAFFQDWSAKGQEASFPLPVSE